MNWQEVCEHPSLKDLPFKIELNEYGEIVMSPVKVNHSAYQAEILRLLNIMLISGRTLVECAVKTRKGTKVADAAWTSPQRFEQMKGQTESPIAPEICVEVLSSGNTEKEIREKRKLYFEKGAGEVWICDEDGKITFYNAQGKIEQSTLAPKFPHWIEL
jgi:Uma2 family endonuclease